MATSKERILARLRANREVEPHFANERATGDAEWLARQPAIADPGARFMSEQEALGGVVREVQDWDALPALLENWLAEEGVQSVMMGTEPRLAGIREHLAGTGRFELHSYDRPVEELKDTVFATDCGITTSRAAIAETGSVVLVPTGDEPRLLSLALPWHLVIVERSRLYATLSEFIRSGEYQGDVPTNLVIASGASRTADIELTLVVGVHGPKRFLVALVG